MRKTENVSEFLKIANELRDSFGFPRDDRFGPRFRGQERAHWFLSPKLFRNYGAIKGQRPRGARNPRGVHCPSTSLV